MIFESGVVPEDRGSAAIVPLYKGKGEMPECKNYRVISVLSAVGKICARILVDKARRGTEGLKVKMGMGRRGVRFLEEKRVQITWPLVSR